MPMYSFRCERCSREMQRLVPMDQRDEQTCDCSGRLVRDGVEMPQEGRVDALASSGGILANGQRIKGDFGSAKRRKGFGHRSKP